MHTLRVPHKAGEMPYLDQPPLSARRPANRARLLRQAAMVDLDLTVVVTVVLHIIGGSASALRRRRVVCFVLNLDGHVGSDHIHLGRHNASTNSTCCSADQ